MISMNHFVTSNLRNVNAFFDKLTVKLFVRSFLLLEY